MKKNLLAFKFISYITNKHVLLMFQSHTSYIHTIAIFTFVCQLCSIFVHTRLIVQQKNKQTVLQKNQKKESTLKRIKMTQAQSHLLVVKFSQECLHILITVTSYIRRREVKKRYGIQFHHFKKHNLYQTKILLTYSCFCCFTFPIDSITNQLLIIIHTFSKILNNKKINKIQNVKKCARIYHKYEKPKSSQHNKRFKSERE